MNGKPDKKIPLVEMFGPTIQGEGAMIGFQTYFFRFGLCDYECKMCDSLHAVKPQEVRKRAQWMTQDEIMQKFTNEFVLKSRGNTEWVTFSGGNPCIHDLTQLVTALDQNGFKIAVETQGTEHPSWLELCHQVTISPKGPGMGEDTVIEDLDAFLEEVGQYGVAKNLKLVVFDQRDLEFASMIYERYVIDRPLIKHNDFYLSLGNPYPPGKDLVSLDGTNQPMQMSREHLTAELIKAYRMLYSEIQKDPILSRVKFLPQWHVIVWGNAQGR